MPSNKNPKISKNSSPESGKNPKSLPISNYKQMYPTWQIGILDIDGRWGYNSYHELIKFNFSDNLLEKIAEHDDNVLYDCISELNKKEDLTIDNFFSHLHSDSNSIPTDILNRIISDIRLHFFIDEIYPKLKSFEHITWDEIEKQTHGSQGKTNNHSIAISNLSQAAKKRLKELNLDDIDEIYSLRLTGKLRIFGLRELNCLKILWIDREHEVCPSYKKHT